jgi:hypothetical protein
VRPRGLADSSAAALNRDFARALGARRGCSVTKDALAGRIGTAGGWNQHASGLADHRWGDDRGRRREPRAGNGGSGILAELDARRTQ